MALTQRKKNTNTGIRTRTGTGRESTRPLSQELVRAKRGANVPNMQAGTKQTALSGKG